MHFLIENGRARSLDEATLEGLKASTEDVFAVVAHAGGVAKARRLALAKSIDAAESQAKGLIPTDGYVHLGQKAGTLGGRTVYKRIAEYRAVEEQTALFTQSIVTNGVAKSHPWRIKSEFTKVDVPNRMIFGWFNVASENGELVIDGDDQVILPDELEQGVYDFNLYSRSGDEMHDEDQKMRLVESMFFSEEKQALLGIDLGRVGWWGGFLVDNDDTLAQVESGDYVAFSIGGTALPEPL